eukprot:COSAG02_NODE_42595_length_383_cov_0.725352_2_plen_44_part_01
MHQYTTQTSLLVQSLHRLQHRDHAAGPTAKTLAGLPQILTACNL